MPHDVTQLLIGLTLIVSLLLLSARAAEAQSHISRLAADKSATGGQKNDNTPVTLEIGKSIEREITGGNAHYYKIFVAARQFLRLIVNQRGIDVIVTLYAPDGKKALEIDSPNPNPTFGPESVLAITVRPANTSDKPGLRNQMPYLNCEIDRAGVKG